MFHDCNTRQRHKPISSPATSLFLTKNYLSKLRARSRKHEIEQKRLESLDVLKFTEDLAISLQENNYQELEDKLQFLYNLLPQEGVRIEALDVLDKCLDVDKNQIKTLSLKCLNKIAFENSELFESREYVKYLTSDSIEIFKLLLELYSYISKRNLNDENLKNIINLAKSLGIEHLDFFKYLANFLTSSLSDPNRDSFSNFINDAVIEIYRILETFPEEVYKFNTVHEIDHLYTDAIVDMLDSLHIFSNDMERKMRLVSKFIELEGLNQNVLMPIYIIICQAISNNFQYQPSRSLFLKLSMSLKSQKRRIKLASLVLASNLAERDKDKARFMLPLSSSILEILESRDSYDIRLESAIFIMHMMFGHGREYINEFVPIEPRISSAILDLLDSCRHDYTTVWLCLDYLEWCLSNDDCVRRLYDLRAIEIIESVQFLHDEEVDRMVCELTKRFDIVEV